MGKIPEYIFVPQKPDSTKDGMMGGCYGCDFRGRLDIRCSQIPCQKHPYKVAKITEQEIS